MFTFPQSETDNGRSIRRLLGSHWNDAYTNQGQVQALVETHAFAERELQQEYVYGKDCLSRFDVPVYRPQRWVRLTLQESKLNSPEIARIRYGTGELYGQAADGSPTVYGGFRPLLYSFAVPEDLRQFVFLSDKVREPTVTLFLGIDVLLDSDRSAITFRENPFARDDLDIRDVYEDGVRVDRELELWMFRPDYEENRIYRQFGYAIGTSLDSSETYRDYVNALWDTLVEGSSTDSIERAISAICDIPLAESQETVEHVVTTVNNKLVITDKKVYRFTKDSEITVSVGDELIAGQTMSDGLLFFDLGRGVCPDPDDVPMLEWGVELLPSGYRSGLAFRNADELTSVDSSGVFTRLEFPVGGFDSDVEKFWSAVHAKGETSPPTLAQLLDVRENPPDEPTAASLPATVNPLQLVVQALLRNHTKLVKLKVAGCGDKQLPLSALRRVRQELAPHTLLLVIVELAISGDSISMSTEDSSEDFAISEAPYCEPSLEITGDTFDLEAATDGQPFAQRVGPLC